MGYAPGRPTYARGGAGRPAVRRSRPRADRQWAVPALFAPRPWVRPAYRRRALRRRRLLIRLLAALVLAAVLAVTWQLATRMDSVEVRPKSEMPSVQAFFYQEDAAWADDMMGNSDRTLGKYGDGVACLASLMAMQHLSAPLEGEADPGNLNAWLSANDAYDGQGNLRWNQVAKLLGVKLTEKKAQRGLGAQMERLLQSEIYPIVRVRRPDTGRDHYVLVVGSVHGEYVIVDPLDPTDTPNTLGIYGNRISSMLYFHE